MAEGKAEFYKKAEESFVQKGYQFFPEKVITGKGRSHASKPDYIAIKNSIVIIGEIKSPAEPPSSASWRQVQKGDGENFKKVRREVAKREAAGKVSKAVGGHEIIISGQIQDYYEKMGKTYDFYSSLDKVVMVIAGYTFPAKEINNVKHALTNCNIDEYEEINTGNGAVSFLFDSLKTNPSKAVKSDSSAPLLAYYCILKNYKGLLKKKFEKNAHIFLFPIPGNKYIYLIIKGKLLEEKYAYFCKLIVEIDDHLLQKLINGQKDNYGKRFLVVEVLPCQIIAKSGQYMLRFHKKGEYLHSDLSLEYLEDGPSYIVRGKLNLDESDRIF